MTKCGDSPRTWRGLGVELYIGENVGNGAAPQYAMERKFVERYSKKMSGSSQKIKSLLLIVFKCK